MPAVQVFVVEPGEIAQGVPKLQAEGLAVMDAEKTIGGVKTVHEYVYGLRVMGTEFYKIGWSRRPDVRAGNFDSWNPLGIEIAFKFLFREEWWGLVVESLIHFAFRHKRVRREWFVLSSSDVDQLTGTIMPFVSTFIALRPKESIYEDHHTRGRVDNILLLLFDRGYLFETTDDERKSVRDRVNRVNAKRAKRLANTKAKQV